LWMFSPVGSISVRAGTVRMLLEERGLAKVPPEAEERPFTPTFGKTASLVILSRMVVPHGRLRPLMRL
jgi:hypothetical protein